MGSSFEGMEGMEGMVGSFSTGGSSSAGDTIFADRIDLPFVTIEYTPGKPIAKERISIPKFPLRNWRQDWYAWLVLTQFVATDWQSCDILPAWAPGGDWSSAGAAPHVQGELDGLVIAAQDERADALGEIVDQSDGFIGYFLDLLTATNGYPETAKLLTIANLVAGFCAMYYKGLYKRPRPSMLCPALMPPLAMPGHASFPSGHSTQAHLMWQCMTDVLNGKPQAPSMLNDMQALADRIARNREIAGLHYPSDSDAGKQLAACILPLLKQPAKLPDGTDDPNPTWYMQALGAAQAEWPA